MGAGGQGSSSYLRDIRHNNLHSAVSISHLSVHLSAHLPAQSGIFQILIISQHLSEESGGMARRGGRQGQMSLIILLLEILDETGDSEVC